jgi:hypothetical protein
MADSVLVAHVGDARAYTALKRRNGASSRWQPKISSAKTGKLLLI